MPTCSRQTLVKGHAFLVKPAYYLKSLYGAREFCVYDVSVMPKEYVQQKNFGRFTSKFSRNPIGCGFEVEYKNMSREAFPIGITSINRQSYAFLMATPEKALCDLIVNSPKVNLRYLKDVEVYLEEDIRMEMDDFKNMDISIFEQYARVGKKSKSIETLIKYLRK